MAFFAGARSVTRIYRGTLPIARAYRGATLVFDRASEGLLAITLDSAMQRRNRDAELSDANDG
jgi:hypothetical protein